MSSNILPKAAAAVAILGIATGVSADSTRFDVNATVQNSLTVVNEQDMELGTLFVVSSASDKYKYAVLTPAGNWEDAEGHSDITLITLGGQQAARGSVAVGDSTPFKIKLPATTYSANLSSDGLDSAATLASAQAASDSVAVRVADPGVARFYLGDFRAGSVVSGASSADCSTNVCTITPAFGATSVSFGIGATLITDLSTTRSAYEEAAYTGSFEVEAGY